MVYCKLRQVSVFFQSRLGCLRSMLLSECVERFSNLVYLLQKNSIFLTIWGEKKLVVTQLSNVDSSKNVLLKNHNFCDKNCNYTYEYFLSI